MIRDLLKIEKLHAFCGKNVSIGSCAKMGSSTLGTECAKDSNSLSLKKVSLINNNTHNIVLIRDVFDKWLTGMYQEMFEPKYLNSDLLDLLKTGYWENQSIVESLDSDDSQRVKHTKKFINSMVKLYEWNGATDLNWMIEGHAKFWAWNDEGLANDSTQSHMGLLSYTELENYYFLELKDLSNPKFIKWLGEQDSSWENAKFEIENQRPPHIKLQFKKFWDEYNEQKICKGSFLVSPYANILELKTVTMSLVQEKFYFNRDVVEHIRNSHPRYLKF
tara:strand:- start:89 stop:916 length:828 start_codon:yes stop_codon:yes gene_type:complete